MMPKWFSFGVMASLFGLMVTSPANATPYWKSVGIFGVALDGVITDFEKIATHIEITDNGLWMLIAPPDPDPRLDSYTLSISKEGKVCGLFASTTVFGDDNYRQALQVFSSLERQLQDSYGEGFYLSVKESRSTNSPLILSAGWNADAIYADPHSAVTHAYLELRSLVFNLDGKYEPAMGVDLEFWTQHCK